MFVIVFINLEAFAPRFVYFRCVAGTAPGPLRVWQFESAADATVYAQTPQCSNRELCFRKREASLHGFLSSFSKILRGIASAFPAIRRLQEEDSQAET